MINSKLVRESFAMHAEVLKRTEESLFEKLLVACDKVCQAIAKGNKILIFGNGGSAADAQHIAAEFTGRFVKERRALAAIALTTDTSALTAIGNDFGFDKVFERQVMALAVRGDILLGISTSGNSRNVLNAFEAGKRIGCLNLGLSGKDGGQMIGLCDITLNVDCYITARIQEMHILFGHIICQAVDENFI